MRKNRLTHIPIVLINLIISYSILNFNAQKEKEKKRNEKEEEEEKKNQKDLMSN